MRTGLRNRASSLSPIVVVAAVPLASVLFGDIADAAPSSPTSSGFAKKRDSNNPLDIDWSPAPSPQDGPPLSVGALRNPAYLPAQIGGIVGSYALSLVIVAIALIALTKRRREHLQTGEELKTEPKPAPILIEHLPSTLPSEETLQNGLSLASPKSPRNFSYPVSPTADQTPYISPSPTSTVQLPGVDFSVDQRVVAADRKMAQQQLEEMYKYVMEQEAAKEAGITLEGPPISSPRLREAPSNSSTATLLKKEKNKPSGLDLSRGEKTQSRASSILSALKSPRKKKMQGVNISSPIMTPMSGTFPRSDGEEMNAIPPRHYAPAAPPPIPTDQVPYGGQQQRRTMGAPLTPDMSPESTQSIDERIGGQLGAATAHSRNISAATTEADGMGGGGVDPVSATSTTPLVGLPSSPKPSVTRFPSLPSSPKPGATFSRPNAPSAVRVGGALPLRAYEPALTSPSYVTHQQTKQTVFERAAPLSPGTARTPWTGAPVPYSPYQPFSPVIPITPSLVTKADRKRMKKLEPKTPTMEMVRSTEDIW